MLTACLFTPPCFTFSDPVTVPQHSNVTEKGLIEPADTRRTTLPTTEHSTVDTNVIWTMSMGTDITDNLSPSNVITTAGESVTSSINYTQTSVTSSPATHTDPYHVNNSTDQEINSNHTLNTSSFADQSVAGNLSINFGSTAFESTEEMRNDSMPHTVHPGLKPSASPEESSTLASVTENSDNPDSTPTLSDVNKEFIEEEGNNYFTAN